MDTCKGQRKNRTAVIYSWDCTRYITFTFSRRFYPKRLTVHSGYTFFICQYVCSLGIEPTTFALLTQCSNHWATGTLWYHMEIPHGDDTLISWEDQMFLWEVVPWAFHSPLLILLPVKVIQQHLKVALYLPVKRHKHQFQPVKRNVTLPVYQPRFL